MKRFTLTTLALVLSAVLFLAPSGARAGGDTLTYAINTDFGTLEVYAASVAMTTQLSYVLNDPIVEMDFSTMTFKPCLAESWKNLDQVTWEFKLRPGVKFHNGNPLTAESVRYTLMDYVLNPENKVAQASNYGWIKDVKVVDDLTFRVITTGPYPIVLHRLAGTFVYDPAHVKAKGKAGLNQEYIGTGPYKLVKWTRGSRLEAVANENYWQKGWPKIKNLVIRIIPEHSVRLAELVGGGVDLAFGLDPDKLDLVQKDPKLKVVSSSTSVVYFWQFDGMGRAAKTPLMDVRVRRAIWQAIDRAAIVKNVLKGNAEINDSPVSRFHFGFDPDLKGYPFDPAKAKALLKEAGYGNGFDLPIWMYTDLAYRFAEAAMGYLSQVGIKVSLKDYRGNIGQMVKIRNAGKVGGVGSYGWNTGMVFDSDSVLAAWFMNKDVKCYNADPELDKWLEEARFSLDQAKRKDLYVKAQRRIVDQAYWMPYLLMPNILGAKKNLDISALPSGYASLRTANWLD